MFKASDEGVTIYSAGGDLDDDGGKHDPRANPISTPYTATNDKVVDGDWVLWPAAQD